MIFVRLSGGLGNQLFQYATARAIALREGVDVVIDDSWYENIGSQDTHRSYELEYFNISHKKISSFQKRALRISRLNFIKKINTKILPMVFEEKNLKFDKKTESLTKNSYLIGYWQSYKYFDHAYSFLIKDLTSNLKIPTEYLEVFRGQKNINSVAVHVRRGDYTSSKNSEIHGICSLDYYQRAFLIIVKNIIEPHFFIFSDDIDWAKKHIVPPGKVVYVNDDGSNSGVQDFLLMKECKNQIIANSTFSWWAAYLNENPKKIVICPKKWFSNKDYSQDDLIPKSWVQC